MSSRIRPAPRVPSKQVKANTLPDTNLRASSAFICPANAGAIAAPATTAPNTKRTSMLQLQLDPSAGKRLMPLYPLLTIPTVATLEQLGWESLNKSGNFYHDSTANLPGEDFGTGLDDPAKVNFMSNFR